MEGNEDPGSMRRDHKVSAARTQDPFDRMLDSLTGLPNGASTKVSAIQYSDFYGNTTMYNIQSVKTEEGVTTFVTHMDAAKGLVRFILPTKVLAAIDRQRASLTKQVRSRHGKRIAEERAAQGLKPGFMKQQ